jgi:molybdate transport repressor ModE-like protein
MLDVRRMRVLREVALQGSFSAAAEALSFTQSAVSQQIAALEREAGTILVQRSARGVRLTEAGEALVRHADAVLARLWRRSPACGAGASGWPRSSRPARR